MVECEAEILAGKYDAMYTEAMRLQSFQDWPYGEDSKCSASKMAEAGFFHCPTGEEKDLVQCYVCFKELDGWEATDEPWAEHLSHSKICVFAQLGKPQKDLKVHEIFRIENERKRNKNKRVTAEQLRDFRSMAEEVKDFITDLKDKVEASRKKQ